MTTLSNFGILKSFLLILLFATIVQANAQDKKIKTSCIAFYNLENLYDTIDDPNINDAEFLPEGTNQWTGERYRTKLSHMAKVIAGIGSDMVKGGPAIIGLAEVENRGVLNDLINTSPLKEIGYQIVQYDSPDARGIDVAMLYKPAVFKLKNSTSNRLTMPGKTDWHSRDQLVVTGDLGGERISIIVNHWPSRGSGPEYRDEAARLSRHLVDSLSQKYKNAKIFIMGDLNDDPTDLSVLTTLGAKGRAEEVKKGDLYNPMWQLLNDGKGSLAYRGKWNLFDQIIISEPLLHEKCKGWKFDQANVYKKEFLIQQDGDYTGYPFRTYGGKTYTGGYSDHLPTYLLLIKK